MRSLQHHLRPASEDVGNIFCIVFAAQTKQHALLLLANQELLQVTASGIKFNSFCAHFAAYAAPQSFVAINRDHLVWRALQRADSPRDERSQGSEKFRRVRVRRLERQHAVVFVFG